MTRLASALDRLGSWTSVAVWALDILGLSSIPNFAPPSSSRELNPDKLVHFSLYFVLSVSRVRGGSALLASRRGRRRVRFSW